MYIEPITDRQKSMIVSNIVKVFKMNDINMMNNQAYDYLNLASGFIAHYNLRGFRDYYGDITKLKEDIIMNAGSNQFLNFQRSDEHYDYYTSRARVYNAIIEAIHYL